MDIKESVERLAFIRSSILDLVGEAKSVLDELPKRIIDTGIIEFAEDSWIREIRINTTNKHGYSTVCAAETMDDTIDRLRRYIRAGE